MFLALLLSVAMADTLTLDSGARLVGELATYEQGGNCYISVTDGDLKGSIVVVMCDQIRSFERGERLVAAAEPVAEPVADPVAADPVPEEVLPAAAPVVMEAMTAPEPSAPPETVVAEAEPLPAAAPVVAEPVAAPIAAAEPIAAEGVLTGAVEVDPALANPPEPAAAPTWRSSAPPPIGARPSSRVPSPSRAPTARDTAVSAPPANAYAQPMESEGNVGW